MKNFEKIIFVCLGNTCRSPIAEFIFKNMPGNENLEIISRGIFVLTQKDLNDMAKQSLKNFDVPFSPHTSTQITGSDVTENTVIVTMTEEIKESLKKYQNVFSLDELTKSTDVEDPYGGTQSDYDLCCEKIMLALKTLKEVLNKS